jgi:hypothetical protein
MATTTNYAWETPDDTDLVKDGAAAIRTLGSSIDTTTKALNPSTTLGDIEYRSATANTNTRLALGTAGQILQVNAGATAPEWATPAGGGGKVLQVIMATTATETTNSTSTMADTSLTATITPSSATSKVLVMVAQQAVEKAAGNAGNSVYFEIRRDSTTISNMGGTLGYENSSKILRFSTNYNYLDEPATTSATTYKTRFRSGVNGQASTVQIDGYASSIILIEIGA